MPGGYSRSLSNTSLVKVAMPHLRGTKLPISATRRTGEGAALARGKRECTAAPGWVAGRSRVASRFMRGPCFGLPRAPPVAGERVEAFCAVQHKLAELTSE